MQDLTIRLSVTALENLIIALEIEQQRLLAMASKRKNPVDQFMLEEDAQEMAEILRQINNQSGGQK